MKWNYWLKAAGGHPAVIQSFLSKRNVGLKAGVWWIGFVVFEFGWVMGAAAPMAPPKEENKQTKPIQIKLS